MMFVTNRNRVGVVVLLAMLMGTAALVVGAGSAGAGVCDGEPFPNDIQVSVHGVATVGVDPFIENKAVWVCLNPPGQESGVGVADPNPSAPGLVVGVWGCGALGGGCGDTVGFTGAEVGVPTTSSSTSTANPGAGAATGAGTCVYVNGTPTCPSALTVAGASIATGDLNVSTRTVTGGCVGAAGNPCLATVPTGAAVTAGGGDSTSDTVDTRVALVGRVNHDVGKTCVVNVLTDCTTP